MLPRPFYILHAARRGIPVRSVAKNRMQFGELPQVPVMDAFCARHAAPLEPPLIGLPIPGALSFAPPERKGFVRATAF